MGYHVVNISLTIEDGFYVFQWVIKIAYLVGKPTVSGAAPTIGGQGQDIIHKVVHCSVGHFEETWG